MLHDMAYVGKEAKAGPITYILMTTVYTAITIPIFDDWRRTSDRRTVNASDCLIFVMTKIAAFTVTIVIAGSTSGWEAGNKALGYQFFDGLNEGQWLLLFIFIFLPHERGEPEVPRYRWETVPKYLLRNDQWIILGVVILLLMCGCIRFRCRAYYAKYYLNGR